MEVAAVSELKYRRVALNDTTDLRLSQHLPLDGTLSFDVTSRDPGSPALIICTNLTPGAARELRDFVDEWLAGGAL